MNLIPPKMFSYQNLHKYIPIKIGISSVFRSIVRALAGLHITIMIETDCQCYFTISEIVYILLWIDMYALIVCIFWRFNSSIRFFLL